MGGDSAIWYAWGFGLSNGIICGRSMVWDCLDRGWAGE